MKSLAARILLAAILPALAPAQVSFDRIVHAGSEPRNWLTYSGNLQGTRFSSLDQIKAGHAANLDLKGGALAQSPANVGGIPEIFDTHTDALFAPGIVGAMADAIEAALDDPATAAARAKSLRERIFLHFSQKAMVEGVMAGYRETFAKR